MSALEFEKKEKAIKLIDLDRIQKLQLIYCGFVDMFVETRKDQELTMVSVCNYTYGFKEKSPLEIYKFSWNDDNSLVFKKLERDLEKMMKKYCK